MGRSQETYNKKEIRSKKEKKRKDKAQKRLSRKEGDNKKSFDDMIAYVDENGQISSTPPDPDKKVEIDINDIAISTSVKEHDESENINVGVVDFYNESKGFGFIKISGNRESLFFHVNNIIGDVKEGNKVTFEVGRGPKGPIALNVELSK